MRRTILITSALPYVNNVPHLGNLIGSMLSADVFARYSRQRGHEVLFVFGTDEHGTATEVQARKEGLSPRALCDKYFALHKEIYAWFGISADVFGRTSDPGHVQVTQEIFNALDKRGFIIEQEVEQLYSEQDGMWLADRYVLGECPYCSYVDARGDQCDSCGRLLTPTELRKPRSALSGATPVLRKTKHLYVDLPALQPQLEAWLAGKEFTANTLRTTAAWIRDGLKPRAITRDLQWGVPVPKPGYEDKVFYVWFDAPIGYISMTAADSKGIDYWWRRPEQVELYQFMGKDNIPFHSVIFPSVLLGTAQPWTMVKHINTTEFLNYETAKFSKSRGTGVFCDDAIKLGFSPDVWRYYLLTNRPETADTAFTWDDFASKLNSELVANLGNLVNRTISFINQFYDGAIPSHEPVASHEEFWQEVSQGIQKVTEHLDQVELKDALHAVMRLSSTANGFFQKTEPWKNRTQNPPLAAAAIATLANFLVDLAILIEPFLPFTARSICEQLQCDLPVWSALERPRSHLRAGHRVGANTILFTKVEPKQVQEYSARFSGKKPALAAQEKVAASEDISSERGLAAIRLVVGKIVSVEKHPNADKLFVEKIFDGERERTVVSGLAAYYQPGELVGKHIVLVANLQPAKLRGVISEGMLLAAENDRGEVGVVLSDEPAGTLVQAAGITPTERVITYDTFAAVPILLDEDGLQSGEYSLSAGKSKLRADKEVYGRVR